MKLKSIYMLAVVAALLSACASVKLAIPTQEDADRGSKQFQGYTLDELNKGKSLYESQCTTCHKLKDPTSKTTDKWKGLVPEMCLKANKKAGSIVIDAKSKDLILKYVLTMHDAAHH